MVRGGNWAAGNRDGTQRQNAITARMPKRDEAAVTRQPLPSFHAFTKQDGDLRLAGYGDTTVSMEGMGDTAQ